MTQALRPVHLPVPEMPELSEPALDALTEEEDSFAHVGRTGGWEKIKAYVDELVEELDQTVLIAMEQGMSFEEIGRRTAVKELTKSYLKRVIDKVESAREAADGRKG